jgi:thymidine kinase
LIKQPENSGWIEVICGCMFSGKSEELIRRLKRAIIARQKVAVFKPIIDQRFHEKFIITHSELKIASQDVTDEIELFERSRKAEVVGIDEAQFFGRELVDICQKLAKEGKRVIVAGLDMDFRGNPFEPIARLLALAEYVTKMQAICVVCGNSANYTQRKVERDDLIVIGASDIYEARCRHCFRPPSEQQQ